jgi:aspartate/methionine/tyrosine aminotransferase
MKVKPFALERYFARYEFAAQYLLSSSDCEALAMSALIDMADDETRSLWQSLLLGYTESMGHPALRTAIADLYPGLGVEDVLVMAPEEGIFLAMHAVLEPGDHVVCTFPAYQSLHEVARTIGCEISYWKPLETGGWHFDLTQLEALMRKETKLVVVNFPHNPTGFLPAAADFRALVERVAARGAMVFSDEMYRGLEIEAGSTLPAACALYDRAISLCGLSKSFGLPGLRIGWVATRHTAVLKRMSHLKDYTTICNSAPSEVLALIALRNRERIIAANRQRVCTNLAVLDRFFARYPKEIEWHPPLGGSVALTQLGFTQDTYAFCEQLVEATGIMLVPSRLFGYGDRHVRIGLGRDNLPDVIERFGVFVDQYLK